MAGRAKLERNFNDIGVRSLFRLARHLRTKPRTLLGWVSARNNRNVSGTFGPSALAVVRFNTRST
jgi:hypothetical protein